MSWQDDPPPHRPFGVWGWLRMAARLIVLGSIVYGCLLLLLLMRLVEIPLGRRFASPRITRCVCRAAFPVLGIRHVVRGTPDKAAGAVVANHSSWLDIFTLNAPQEIFFVSKAEVEKWPGIGILAAATGTVFIHRRSSHAGRQRAQFLSRIAQGDRLCFFPEGTSTDSRHVLPFKSTLFAAFFDAAADNPGLLVQPVSVNYIAPPGEDPRFYGWWGDMDFGPHLFSILAAPGGGRVELVFHPAVRIADFADRKALAKFCEGAVRSGLIASADGRA